ncbi:unnamed protein product [Hyaloperonospora brassicae]|uniref:RCC1-like domain-containing protein n=1 Tax=Hyaloperonospora brassicae TaxID=162125 RepID=A0AAV0U6Y2_HYABA|nr:unnamed protein product [Hyaloperonospora brassicae]
MSVGRALACATPRPRAPGLSAPRGARLAQQVARSLARSLKIQPNAVVALQTASARTDTDAAKEQLHATPGAAPSPPNGAPNSPIPRAPDQVLKRRKVVTATPKSRYKDEAARQLTALNRAFVANLKDSWSKNMEESWVESMKEYLRYAQVLDDLFGGHSGHVLTFGSGDCGQLGHGVADEDLMAPFPRVVRSLSKLEIVRVACGGLHSAAITAAGEVYTWGCNDDGAIGRDGDENVPAKVDGFGPQEAVALQIVGGDCHTSVVTLAGEVYTWGCYRDKEGKQWCDAPSAEAAFKQKQPRPYLIKSLDNVVDVRCGSSFNLVRTNNGLVFSWGLGEIGELGREVDAEMKDSKGEYRVDMVYSTHLQPARVMLEKNPLPPVKDIGCGSYHSIFALASPGHLYTCGLNNYGQLGIGHTENCTELQLVEDLSSENVTFVDGGAHHSVVLTLDGDVYTFGRADSGQLGVLETCVTGAYKDRPQKVTIPTPKSGGSSAVRMIATGSNHALALTESDAIFSWGYGDMLALGNGKERDENKPRQLDWSTATSDKGKKFGEAKIFQIEAGGQHSAVLARATKDK